MTTIKAKLAVANPGSDPDDVRGAIESWMQKNVRGVRLRPAKDKSSSDRLVYEGMADIEGIKVGIGIEFEW